VIFGQAAPANSPSVRFRADDLVHLADQALLGPLVTSLGCSR
jgi:hypothetical protein